MTVSRGGSRMQFAAGANLSSPEPDPPVDPPTNVDWEYYSGDKILYTWTNAGHYTTQYSYDSGDTVEGSRGPSQTSFASGSSEFQAGFAVRHISGAYASEWALILG